MYTVLNSTGLVEETRMTELIAKEITLNPTEALMAIRQLRKAVQRLLLHVPSVTPGTNWATINITFYTSGVANRIDLSIHNILRMNLNFQPGKEFLTALQKAEFI